jgi:DNA-binding beta-propeller fold protein YncE
MNRGLFISSVCVTVLAGLLISCGTPAATPAADPTVNEVLPTVEATSTTVPVATKTAEPAPELELAWKTTGDPNAFDVPAGVAVDGQGNVYVMDTGNYRVQKFDAQGIFLSMWGNKGKGEGQFLSVHIDRPIGYLDVDRHGNIYAIDIGNLRIQKLDGNGNYQAQWGAQGNGDGEFKDPIDIAVDQENNIYVADIWNNTVQKFDSAGNFLLRWGTTGYQDGQFQEIFSLAIDPDGNVLVAEAGGRLQKFDSNGNFLSKIPLNPVDNRSVSTWNIDVDSLGNIYIDDGGFRILKVDPQGQLLAVWSPPELGDVINRFVLDITVDAQGNIYLADPAADTVYKFMQPGFDS